MRHPSVEEWEQVLKKIIDELDDVLEDRYGKKYRLHPSRSKRGSTSSKAHDGLFDITTNYTMGLGSKHGKGYVVDVHLSTLEKVPKETLTQIEDLVIQQLRQKLPEHFPDAKLSVEKDGNVIKIFGDLSLGKLF